MRCTPSHLVRLFFVFVASVIPYTNGDAHLPAFGTNAAQQYQILPVVFIQISVYKWYVIAVLALFALQTILITTLLLERKRRWHSSKRLNESEERFSKAFRGNPQPMSLTTLEGGRYLDVNASFLMMSGYTGPEIIDHTSVELHIFKTEEERHQLLVEPLLTKGSVRNLEMAFRTKSGDFKTLLSSAELLDLAGQKCILVASSDISDRKILEEDLRLSEREFSTLVQNSPDIISRLDRDLRFIYISPALVTMTDIPPENFIGKTPTEMALPGYDFKSFEAACLESVNAKTSVHRVFTHGNKAFSTRIIPEFSPEGEVESLMTICEDVTDRVRSEKELTDLTVRLFTIQDDERRRIARELHDGTAQNLFAISLNLAKLETLANQDNDECHSLITESQSLVEQSLQEIRTLSYLLHPPLLDQAGLVSALQWYVQGFTKRSGIYIDLFAQPIGRLHSDIEMALFRVVQEALTNVRRHSGSDIAKIRLERREETVVLEISDQGNGFETVSKNGNDGSPIVMGVGIPGMRQRLRQLGGKLEIKSNELGTNIAVVVPLTNGANHGTNPSRR
jgi:PAS domain S-box-containing protein